MTDTFKILAYYLSYVLMVAVLLVLITFYPSSENSTVRDVIHTLFAFSVGCRGFVDALVWFYMHEFQRTSGDNSWNNRISQSSQSYSISKSISSNIFCGCCSFFSIARLSTANDVHDVSRNESDFVHRDLPPWECIPKDIEESDSTDRDLRILNQALSDPLINYESRSTGVLDSVGDNISSRELLSAGLPNDIDLSPQLNHALRKEVVTFVTDGIIKSVQRWAEKEKLVTNSSMHTNLNSFNSFNNSTHQSKVVSPRVSRDDTKEHHSQSQRNMTWNSSSSLKMRTNESYYHNSGSSHHDSSYIRSSLITALVTAGTLVGHYAVGEYGEDMKADLTTFQQKFEANKPKSKPYNDEDPEFERIPSPKVFVNNLAAADMLKRHPSNESSTVQSPTNHNNDIDPKVITPISHTDAMLQREKLHSVDSSNSQDIVTTQQESRSQQALNNSIENFFAPAAEVCVY
jgi:hypothetical protein